MICRVLIVALIVAGFAGTTPCRAQVEPALPSWNWDNPMGDPTPWAPSAITYIEVGALALALDLYFGGRVSGASYRAVIKVGQYLFAARPRPAALATAVR